MPKSTFPFMELPLELRRQVYRYAATPGRRRGPLLPLNITHETPDLMALSQTCQKIRDEIGIECFIMSLETPPRLFWQMGGHIDADFQSTGPLLSTLLGVLDYLHLEDRLVLSTLPPSERHLMPSIPVLVINHGLQLLRNIPLMPTHFPCAIGDSTAFRNFACQMVHQMRQDTAPDPAIAFHFLASRSTSITMITQHIWRYTNGPIKSEGQPLSLRIDTVIVTPMLQEGEHQKKMEKFYEGIAGTVTI